MQEHPLISVLVVAYNNADLIYDALDSIFMQDYPNIELIISDDASTMPFPASEIIEYVEQHRGENIRQVILNQNSENLGTVRHLEVIREKSHGEIELVIAADDAWADAGVFSAFASVFQNFPEAECVTSQLGMYDRELKIKTRNYISPADVKKLKTGDMEWLRDECACRCVLPSIGTAYRRTIFAKIGRLSDTYSLIEDYSTQVRITRMRIPVYYLDHLTAKHREGGISHGNTRNSFDFFQKLHRDYDTIYEKEVLGHKDEYSEKTLERAEKYYLHRQDLYRYEEERQHIANGEAPARVSPVADTTAPAAATAAEPEPATQSREKTILGYSSFYVREIVKNALKRISTWQQMQLMLITAAATLLASAFLQGWQYTIAPLLGAILFWIGAICMVGFLFQLCCNLLFKLRRCMWFLRGRKG